MNYQETCCQFFDRIFKEYEYPVVKEKDLKKVLLNIVVGTQSTTRLGAMPSEETKKEILRRIQIKLEQNKPLEISCAWGAIKTVKTKDRNVDLAEFLALKQYHAIYEAVKSVYKPGIRFNIYLGDSYYKYLYGDDNKIETYCKGMEFLTKGSEEIRLIRLSNQCKKVENVNLNCEKNYELLRNYWVDTNNISVEKHSEIPSTVRLYEGGWVGVITPAVREFYLKRMASLYPGEGQEYWTEKILRFFAYALMISQNDLMGRKSMETSTVDSCLLRVPPPDLPRKLYSNRIRMRITPENVVKTSAPPWTVAGAISYNDKNEAHVRLLDSTTYQKIKMEKIDYEGISFGIFNEKHIFMS